jgi:hypothetical protein
VLVVTSFEPTARLPLAVSLRRDARAGMAGDRRTKLTKNGLSGCPQRKQRVQNLPHNGLADFAAYHSTASMAAFSAK